ASARQRHTGAQQRGQIGRQQQPLQINEVLPVELANGLCDTHNERQQRRQRRLWLRVRLAVGRSAGCGHERQRGRRKLVGQVVRIGKQPVCVGQLLDDKQTRLRQRVADGQVLLGARHCHVKQAPL